MNHKKVDTISYYLSLEIARKMIDQKVTNDLDIISSIVNVCKEDVISYIKKPNHNSSA
ncbi:MAG: hypothetical protein ACQEV7_00710 [Bacillota bacterium]